MSYRIDKVSRLIKEEISWIFIHKLKDPALGFITITDVKLSPDLKIAKIYFSVLEKENRKIVLARINEVKGLIRGELAHRIKMRFIPELSFFIDDTTDYVEKMENLFRQINKENDKNNNDNQNDS
ncbi:MAG: 30S ribosome-binding factor RbfA [Bacteroidota bacterium]|nr:30S ribosome-binding factor RbfA [Bacteroidota bacterium]MDP4192532.1 30S ribosome-binding factor RbfA [Bacteroidota bacterium]MDP4194120.1 30S ribosome-binding factor RbfA [Bacteroidota bacterium]